MSNRFDESIPRKLVIDSSQACFPFLLTNELSNRFLVKRVTIADIAARAGVSKSTVSHALSGKRTISLATQSRIHAVIAEVGYRPNVVAQRLAGGGHSRNIGLVFPLSTLLIAGTETEFIVNAANAANAADYTFLLLTHLEGNTAQFERIVESKLVDGFILMKVHMHDPRVELMRRERIPFILLGRCAHNDGLSFVDVDIEAGVADAMAHLAQLGHRKVAYLPFIDEGDFGFAVRAHTSFQRHCLQYGITPLIKPCNATLAGAEAAFDDLFSAAERPSALLVRSETIAEGIGRSAAKHGLHIPTDLSLISMGSASNPMYIQQGSLRLSWIDIRAETLAVTATNFLLEHLESNVTDVKQRLITPQLVIGDSCGVASSASIGIPFQDQPPS